MHSTLTDFEISKYGSTRLAVTGSEQVGYFSTSILPTKGKQTREKQVQGTCKT